MKIRARNVKKYSKGANMLNQCNFIGNCGKDPEVRYTQDGTAVASVSIAVSEKYKDRSGESRENTEWINVVAWNKLADIMKSYVHKGDKIFISGKMKCRSWTDKDGNQRKTTEIVAHTIELLGGRPSERRESNEPQPSASNDAFGDSGINDSDIPF